MQKDSHKQVFYDTEVSCASCGERLCLTAAGVVTVRDALKRTGIVGLQCVCGRVQLIGPDFKPLRRMPSSTKGSTPCQVGASSSVAREEGPQPGA